MILLFLLSAVLFGAGAIFTDQIQKKIKVGTAAVEFEYQILNDTTYPETVTEDTVITREFQITNTGTAPIYLLEEPFLVKNSGYQTMKSVMMEIGEIREKDQIITDKAVETALEPQGSRIYRCDLRFQHITKESKEILLRGGIRITGFTGADRQSGFYYGPIEILLFDFSNGELTYGRKGITVLLEENVIDLGNVEIEGVNWYRSAYLANLDQNEGKDAWQIFDASCEVEITDQPLYVRYEIVTAAGIVRSNIFEIVEKEGDVQALEFDLFTGERNEVPIEI